MSDLKKRIDNMVRELKTQRDELQVKLHLAKMDVGDEWGKLSVKLSKLEAKAKELSGVTAEASQDVSAATKLLADELRDGFKKIARHF